MERRSGDGRQLCPCQCHWDLSWLHFGDTRIAVTDVDGLFVVERGGYFLFMETKGLDEPLTQGQRIMLTALSHQPRTLVVVLYGKKGYPEILQRIRKGEFLGVQDTDREDFQRRVDTWFDAANIQMAQVGR